MAHLHLYRDKLARNYQYLDNVFSEKGISWAVVTKLLCGNRDYITEVLNLGATEVCDSRISNLSVIKDINPNIQTVYIKPPAQHAIPDIVRFADASFNTETETIRLISEEAGKQGKVHKIIIMIELGDLREGIMGDHLIEFYSNVFKLPHIQVTGIGTNLTCLNGVLPSEDKLIQLSLYEQLIEAKFDRKIPWVTGGTSVVLPLLLQKQVPDGINHFRIGETLFFGNNLISEAPLEGMEQDVFRLFAEIIEITEKPKVPIGFQSHTPSGKQVEVDDDDFGQSSYRAILDIGLLDISTDLLISEDQNLSFVGASSDMVVVDLGPNTGEYKVGDVLSFRLKYMGALRVLSSDYIEKLLI